MAAPPSQAPGRPRVPDTVEDERNTFIMSQLTNAAPSLLVPAQRRPENGCKPWCISHDVAESICQGPDAATPGGQWSGAGRINMSHGPAGGTLFTLVHDPDAELTAGELMQLVQVALDQLALALGMTR
jgi:hypothetical protein